MRRGVLTSARLMEADLPPGGFRFRPAMVTLTYRPGVEWCPSHVRDFLQRVRVWANRKGFALRYVWVAELQQRGAVHYHVVLWLPFAMPKADKRGWWPHGSTKSEWARTAVGYLAKYASKGDGSGLQFPPRCRIHGTGGLSPVSRRCRRWWMYPQALRSVAGPQHDVHRFKGGGFVSRVTGEILPPLWGLSGAGSGQVRLTRLRQQWPPLLPVAPSSLVELREVAAFDKSLRGPVSSSIPSVNSPARVIAA